MKDVRTNPSVLNIDYFIPEPTILFISSNMKVHNVFTCERPVEASNFQSNIGNIQQLFHSSKAPNFLGILSRSLLSPKIVVSDFGGERSDVRSLGTGIYFGLNASTSVRYSSPGETRGSRLLLVCDVALGSVKVGWYVRQWGQLEI